MLKRITVPLTSLVIVFFAANSLYDQANIFYSKGSQYVIANDSYGAIKQLALATEPSSTQTVEGQILSQFTTATI